MLVLAYGVTRGSLSKFWSFVRRNYCCLGAIINIIFDLLQPFCCFNFDGLCTFFSLNRAHFAPKSLGDWLVPYLPMTGTTEENGKFCRPLLCTLANSIPLVLCEPTTSFWFRYFTNLNVKGIVARKFDIHFCYH
jgi:hypothetical protein